MQTFSAAEAVVKSLVTHSVDTVFGVQELATTLQHKFNLVAIVFNNNSFGHVRRDQLDNLMGV